MTSAPSPNFGGHGLRLPYRHLHTKDSIEDSSQSYKDERIKRTASMLITKY